MRIVVEMSVTHARRIRKLLGVLGIPESEIQRTCAEFIASEHLATDVGFWLDGYTYPDAASAKRAAESLFKRSRLRTEFTYWHNGQRWSEVFVGPLRLDVRRRRRSNR